MTNQIRERVRQKLSRARRAAYYADTRSARLGILNADGSVNEDIGDGLTSPLAWVRIGGERTATQAVLLAGVSTRLPDAEVIVGELPGGGGWEVIGLDPARAVDTYGDLARSFSQTETVPEVQTVPVMEKRLMPGMVMLSSAGGLNITALTFQHEHGYFEGDDLLLTPTSTSGAKALHLITLDPVTNTLSETLSADLPATYEITDAALTEVMQDVDALIPVPPGEIPLAAVLLANGATSIDVRNIVSRRIWLAVPDMIRTLQTTDATATTLCSVPLAEAAAIRVEARVIGARDDWSATASRGIALTARRAAGGNVTLVGAVVYDDAAQEDSAGSPVIEADVDTGTQSVRIRVAGIAAQTWNWRSVVKVVRL